MHVHVIKACIYHNSHMPSRKYQSMFCLLVSVSHEEKVLGALIMYPA